MSEERGNDWVENINDNIKVGIIIGFLLLLAILFLLFASSVLGESQNTTVTIQTSAGFCAVSTPNYFVNLDANNNYTTTFNVIHTYNNTNITYVVLQNYSIINKTDILENMGINLSCPTNVTLTGFNESLTLQSNDYKSFLAEYLNNKLLPQQAVLDGLETQALFLEDKNKNLTFELNVTQIALDNLRYQNRQLTDEKNQAWTFFFIMLGLMAVLVVVFSGLLEKLGIGKPRVRV